MGEFTKIELASEDDNNTSEKTESAMAKRSSKNTHKAKRKIFITFISLTVFLVVSSALLFGPVQKTYSSAQKTYQQSKKAWDAIKKQNVALASTELDKAKQDLLATQRNLKALSFLRFIPLANNYYNDADHLVKAGLHGFDAASILVDSIKPYADILGLKGEGSFTMGSAEQRIQTAVMTMGKITPRIDDISKSLSSARVEIDAVNPKHYPSLFGGGKVKKKLSTVQTLVDQAVTFTDEARPLIKVLPSLLGETTERKYLVLFQNDKELRPTGGFITAYALFRIDKGVIHVERSDDIYNLDNSVRKKLTAPPLVFDYLYLRKNNNLNLRDANISPDFTESMKTFMQLYDTIPQKSSIDGIIALDTHVLVSTIKILDDEVVASGIKFNTQEDQRCFCPQVIYVLEDNISRPVNYVKSGRKDLLGSLLYAIMQKSLRSSPKKYWGPLFQELLTQANQKHVLFYLFDKDAQSGVEAMNAAGRIAAREGDYLHINEANLGGAKSNMYVSEAVTQEINSEKDGSITKTITIRYKNPFKPSDCNLERGGLCLNADLRDWIRIYVPKGSTLISSKGSEVKMTSYEELGKTVFDGFLRIRPLGTATLTFSYKLPFKVASDSSLPLLIQKQPGTDNNEYTIKVNGKEVEKFELLTDKKIKLKW